jgi:3-isopropylmalate/(R)-2-methylmalate dehydratase small subunit
VNEKAKVQLTAEEKDLLEIDLGLGEIRNLTRNTVFTALPYPEFIRELISAGGLLEYARRLLAQPGESKEPIRK